MCGIAGLIAPNESEELRRSRVVRMCETMLHRGPDDAGDVSRGPATLGMRRLAIIDPAGGHQPMRSARGRYDLVFNGCIYNHRDLRAELVAFGHPFRTQCDTETLLVAFACWGEDCLSRLRGMFAFAVWDDHTQSLFLAREGDPVAVDLADRGPVRVEALRGAACGQDSHRRRELVIEPPLEPLRVEVGP